MIQPITKDTFRGDSNSREWQLMRKLAEVTEELNKLSAWAANIADFAERDLAIQAEREP